MQRKLVMCLSKKAYVVTYRLTNPLLSWLYGHHNFPLRNLICNVVEWPLARLMRINTEFELVDIIDRKASQLLDGQE